MITVIYRRLDGIIAGFVSEQIGKATRENAISQEITNIINSELGGEPTDYASVETDPLPPGEVFFIGAFGDLDSRIHPVITARKAAKKRGLAVLKSLGLTNEELQALGL